MAPREYKKNLDLTKEYIKTMMRRGLQRVDVMELIDKAEAELVVIKTSSVKG
jgi:ribosomal protein S3AE